MYESFFSFREKPFNITSDPGFLFMSQHHQEAFDHLVYGINERKGFLVITGEIGAGKTTISKALLNKIEPTTATALVLNPQLSEMQLLKAVLTDFGLEPKGRTKFDLVSQLNAFLLVQLHHRTNAVLIIDEAQNMSLRLLEQVRLLSNLETEKQKLLQIILVGQPELRQKLASPKLLQLKQRVSVSYHIPPLTQKDMTSYIYHRLKVAGAHDTITFDSDALAAIYTYTNGVPRLVNIVCDKALLAAFVETTKHITGLIIHRCIAELEGEYDHEHYQRSFEESSFGNVPISHP